MRSTAIRSAVLALCVLISFGTSACQRKTAETSSSDQTGAQNQPVQVSMIELGRGLGSDKRVADRTESFAPNETVYATVLTSGAAPSAEIKARWTYQDGQVVDESSQTITPDGDDATEFHVSKPDGWPTGRYKVEVFLNGSSAGTKEFEVKRT